MNTGCTDIEAGKSSFIAFLPISWITQKGPIKIGHAASLVCPLAAGALWRVALGCRHVYPKISSHDLHMLCPSMLMLAASVIASTTLLVAPTCSLQLLAYMYFVVATMPHLLEALASYHELSCKAIS